MDAVSGARSFIAGLVGLSLLEMIVSNRHGEAGRVAGAMTTVADVLSYWLDPMQPLIPNIANWNVDSSHQILASGGVGPAVFVMPKRQTTPASPKPAVPA